MRKRPSPPSPAVAAIVAVLREAWPEAEVVDTAALFRDPAVLDAEIDEMLARLQTLSDDHFNAHPDEINWGHVGTLEHYASLLKRITDSAFGEGEHAE